MGPAEERDFQENRLNVHQHLNIAGWPDWQNLIIEVDLFLCASRYHTWSILSDKGDKTLAMITCVSEDDEPDRLLSYPQSAAHPADKLDSRREDEKNRGCREHLWAACWDHHYSHLHPSHSPICSKGVLRKKFGHAPAGSCIFKWTPLLKKHFLCYSMSSTICCLAHLSPAKLGKKLVRNWNDAKSKCPWGNSVLRFPQGARTPVL